MMVRLQSVSQYCVVFCVRLVVKWDSSASAVGTVAQLTVGSEKLQDTFGGEGIS